LQTTQVLDSANFVQSLTTKSVGLSLAFQVFHELYTLFHTMWSNGLVSKDIWNNLNDYISTHLQIQKIFIMTSLVILILEINIKCL